MAERGFSFTQSQGVFFGSSGLKNRNQIRSWDLIREDPAYTSSSVCVHCPDHSTQLSVEMTPCATLLPRENTSTAPLDVSSYKTRTNAVPCAVYSQEETSAQLGRGLPENFLCSHFSTAAVVLFCNNNLPDSRELMSAGLASPSDRSQEPAPTVNKNT